MGRSKKLFLGVKPIGGPTLKSRRVARIVTSKYHSIRNEQVQISRSIDLSEKEKSGKIKALETELDELGGTNRYQQASIISTEFFKTSKWVLQTLDALGMRSNTANIKLDLLEVGAINIQLKQCGWMNVRSIDVNSQHPLIEECDFFDVEPVAAFDVVVCNMVVNCVTEPHKRGEMLARLSAQLKLSKGVLLLVLPLRCVDSKHVGGTAGFDSLLRGLGLTELLPRRVTPKLAFYILGNRDIPVSSSVESSAVSTSNWVQRVRGTLSSSLSEQARELFSRDFSAVPPTEFSVSLPKDLLSTVRTKSSKRGGTRGG